jgi:23S rRNA pseudouridine2605 synthase
MRHRVRMKRKPNPSSPPRHRDAVSAPSHGLARVLNRLGLCSRSQAQALVREGRVRVNGHVVLDPDAPADAGRDRIEVDGAAATAATKVYVALNKPRGYVTTASDEQGRQTVYTLLQDIQLPQARWLAPVGRLDKASEGLLLFSNDSAWAARMTDPLTHLAKTYHVQIDALPDPLLLQRMRDGIDDDGEQLAVRSVQELRRGEKNAWLEVVLDEGRNRHIRRLLAAFDIAVLRLVRVAIGSLELGDLPKGKWRILGIEDAQRLAPAPADRASQRQGTS